MVLSRFVTLNLKQNEELFFHRNRNGESGHGRLDDLNACLTSLSSQTLPVERAKEVIAVAGAHLPAASENGLKQKFPWLVIHRSERDLSYIEAKVRGAELANGDIVVFADSDVVYQATWLENLLGVFDEHPEATVATGETRLHTVTP